MGGRSWPGVGPGDRRAAWRGLAARRSAAAHRACGARPRATVLPATGSLPRADAAALISIGPASTTAATDLPFQNREPLFAVDPALDAPRSRPAKRRVRGPRDPKRKAMLHARLAWRLTRRRLRDAASMVRSAVRAAMALDGATVRAAMGASAVRARAWASDVRSHVSGNWRRETQRWRAVSVALADRALGVLSGARSTVGALSQHLTRRDALVAGVAALALLGPIASPRLGPETAMALSRDNPLVERRSVRAEFSPVVLPASAPTLWNGRSSVRARRAVAPQWVHNALDRRRAMSIALALVEGPRVIEVGAAPLWSPHLAAGGFEAADEERWGAEDWLADAPTGADIETASIDAPVDDEDLAPARDLTVDGQSAPPGFALRPPRRPAGGPAAASPAGVASASGGGEITILITAVGLNRAASLRAIEQLPGAIAVAVPPVARDPREWVAAAQATGRVVLAEVPMEHGFGRVNRDALTLLTSLDPTENVSRLEATLERVPGVDGVATYLGGRFTTDAAALRPVLLELSERDLFVVETGATAESRLSVVARELGVPQLAAIVSLDRGGRSDDLADALARLEAAAQSGPVLGVATALPGSIDALIAWAAEAEARGVRLRPLRL